MTNVPGLPKAIKADENKNKRSPDSHSPAGGEYVKNIRTTLLFALGGEGQHVTIFTTRTFAWRVRKVISGIGGRGGTYNDYTVYP